MTSDPCIMVATEIEGDATVVQKLLTEEFSNVVLSTNPKQSKTDFETFQPDVLILAFNTLEKAERYYLGLYRFCEKIHLTLHRTLILCNKDDLPRVYELCRQGYFDDYILFWPLTFDAPRILLAVHHALAHLQRARSSPLDVHDFADSARTVGELEPRLRDHAKKGRVQIDAAGQALAEAASDLGAVVDGLSRRLAADDMRRVVSVLNPTELDQEIHDFRVREIDRFTKTATAALEPLRQWSESLPETVAPQIESAKKLGDLARQVKPVVLVVDDDSFQHTLLRSMLPTAQLETLFALSATEAFVLMRSRLPDLILMDINLPDINGVMATRRIRSIKSLARTPVVMITGQSTKDMVVESLRAGATDFMAKPIEKAVLLDKVERLLGLKHEE